jgi:hypothetical protein
MPAIKESVVDTYEESMGRLELYNALEAGLNQIKNGENITKV